MTRPLALRFAEYSHALRFEDLPAPVVHETKRRFIDSFATAVGAMPADAFGIAKKCATRVRRTRAPACSEVDRAARMGDLRERPPDPLPRLQRYLSISGTGPPE